MSQVSIFPVKLLDAKYNLDAEQLRVLIAAISLSEGPSSTAFDFKLVDLANRAGLPLAATSVAFTQLLDKKMISLNGRSAEVVVDES